MDLLDKVREKDFQYIANFRKEKYQGLTEMHDLIIDLGTIDRNTNLILFLNGWIYPTDASINVAMSQSYDYKVQAPCLEVQDGQGTWHMVIENIGFPSGKDKTLAVDLTGKIIPEDNPVVRIRTNMEIYWDQIFYSNVKPESPYNIHNMSLESADLHYRGFSATYRKGGRNGPFWFDYHKVVTGQKWRDLEGRYTRFGDVRDLLLEAENKYVVMNAGDEMTVTFNQNLLPDLPASWQRDFIIYTVGWVKDGDLNTASGNRVEPYPHHGMETYPQDFPGNTEQTGELQTYFRKYNTREVTNEAFRNEIRNDDE